MCKRISITMNEGFIAKFHLIFIVNEKLCKTKDRLTSVARDHICKSNRVFKFEYEYEIKYENHISILVFRLHIIT